jgi:putative FmdB family regulatory protein
MPIYEYQCPTCGRDIEKFLKVSECLDMYCPTCGGEMDMTYSVPSVRIFREYTTTHILPHGKPITITSERHESSVLRENGLCKADSNPTK